MNSTTYLGMSESPQSRMLELADSSNRGQLSPAEHEQMESHRRVANFLALLHTRDRLSLQHAGRTIESNLELSCFDCNTPKGPTLRGSTPTTVWTSAVTPGHSCRRHRPGHSASFGPTLPAVGRLHVDLERTARTASSLGCRHVSRIGDERPANMDGQHSRAVRCTAAIIPLREVSSGH